MHIASFYRLFFIDVCCAGSDKSFPTVEGLLRSRTLTFPRPGELGAPNQMTFASASQGRVASAADLAEVAAAPSGGGVGPAGAHLPPPPAPMTSTSPQPAQNQAPSASYENNEALEKVLACLVNPVSNFWLFSSVSNKLNCRTTLR